MRKGMDKGADPARLAEDSLIDIAEIRRAFGIGGTAAYELTHRRGFPDPVLLSPRCYRWWASEVAAFAAALQQRPARRRTTWSDQRRPPGQAVPLQITGTVRAAHGRKEQS